MGGVQHRPTIHPTVSYIRHKGELDSGKKFALVYEYFLASGDTSQLAIDVIGCDSMTVIQSNLILVLLISGQCSQAAGTWDITEFGTDNELQSEYLSMHAFYRWLDWVI